MKDYHDDDEEEGDPDQDDGYDHCYYDDDGVGHGDDDDDSNENGVEDDDATRTTTMLLAHAPTGICRRRIFRSKLAAEPPTNMLSIKLHLVAFAFQGSRRGPKAQLIN